MNKPLLLSLAAATILTSSLSAESMYERIQSMELKMMQMQEELVTLKANGTHEAEDDEDEETVEDRLSDLEESVTDINKATNGSHLKFAVDYRSSCYGRSRCLCSRYCTRYTFLSTLQILAFNNPSAHLSEHLNSRTKELLSL